MNAAMTNQLDAEGQESIHDEKTSMKICGWISIKTSTAGYIQKLVVKRAQGTDEI